MAESDGGEATIDDIPPFDLGDWEQRVTETESQPTLECISPARKHKIEVKPVSFHNPDVPTGFLIEFYKGEEAYARHRDKTADEIVPDPELVPRKLRDIIVDETDETP